jgi:hypothetical protein
MEQIVVLSREFHKHLDPSYNDQDLIRDVHIYKGTINSLGHRLDIVINESQAVLLLLKYPDLKIRTQRSSDPAHQPLRDITVRIAV